MWAVLRRDVGDEPVFLRMDNEQMAREWYAGFLEGWKRSAAKSDDWKPELVAARIHWQVQE